eukprot:353271-Hanusia_phi.AAC.1
MEPDSNSTSKELMEAVGNQNVEIAVDGRTPSDEGKMEVEAAKLADVEAGQQAAVEVDWESTHFEMPKPAGGRLVMQWRRRRQEQE